MAVAATETCRGITNSFLTVKKLLDFYVRIISTFLYLKLTT